jgi:outer membrane protein assembly factor BamB
MALVGSDDGWAYAFEAATGRLVGRFRAAPVERKIRVYNALASTWPVASGVLVDKDTAYFAAGMDDFDGTHVYALDLAEGRIVWQNNGSGHLDGFSKRGVACQGELLLHDGKLYLAGGNAVSPGVFDAATGRCLNSPPGGLGTSAPRGRELHLVGNQVRVSGQPLHSIPESPVFDPSTQWARALVTAQNAKLECVERPGAKGQGWAVVAQDSGGRELWSHALPAEPVRYGLAIDAQGRVIVALRSGALLCLGNQPNE